MIVNGVAHSRPSSIAYSLLGSPVCAPSQTAVVLPNFLDIPLHVQSECRRLSYLNHFPKRVGRRGVFPQFHRYDPDTEQVLGIFGDIGPHRDGPAGGGKRLTAGLILVNDGSASLGMGEFTARGRTTARTQLWPLPVGSLYVMDSSQEHTTVSQVKNALLAFAAFDFEAQDNIPVEELRAGMTDVLRRVFGYELELITTAWSGGTNG